MSRKVPKFGHNPQEGKSARVSPSNTQSEEKTPLWSLSIVDHDGPWGWGRIDNALLLRDIQELLKNYETMDWNHILHRTNSHSIAKWKICKDAQQRLQAIGQDDIDDLISLRKTNRERIWGIKDRHILKILWWDPEHTVYPTEMKNT